MKLGLTIDIKKVWFSLEDGNQIDFTYGCIRNMMINSMKARIMLSKGYIGFLAHMVSKVKLGLSIDDTLVV